MPWVVPVVTIVVFAVLPAIVRVAALGSSGDDTFPDVKSARDLLLSQLVALALVVLVISLSRWWPPVLHEPRRDRRWVWCIPVVMVVTSLAVTDWSRLAQMGVGFLVVLLAGAVAIGASEELLFRGVVLTFLRDRYREEIAAIATAVVFGLVHLVSGPLNAVFSAVFGYLLYHSRRVSGGLVVPIVMHTLYDFSVFSTVSTANPADAAPAGFVQAMVSLVLLVVLVVARKRVAEPGPSAGAGSGPGARTPGTPAAPTSQA